MNTTSAVDHESISSPASYATSTVFVVDDDASVRESLELLIDSAGWQAQTFATAKEFLACPRIVAPSCLVLDVTLPDLNGLDLQKRIAVDRRDMPIIFISGHGDVPMTVQAMKAGAVEFLTKPLRGDVLLSAIQHAIERSSAALGHEEAMRSLRECYASLTASRTGGHGAGSCRLVEQAGRWRARHQRDHGEGTQRPSDAKDGGRLSRRSGAYVRKTLSRTCIERPTLHRPSRPHFRRRERSIAITNIVDTRRNGVLSRNRNDDGTIE